MIPKNTLEEARRFVFYEMTSDTSGHDWWHARRVSEMARKIAAEEGADPNLCELAALLHDIPDDKRGLPEEEGLSRVRAWLTSQHLCTETIGHILVIIQTMSFRGGNNPPMESLEGKIVQDADRLDAIGAIGIARTFVYSGHSGQKMYDPGIPVRDSMTRKEYRDGTSTAINHFYEKLLKLEKLMNTSYARKIAAERQTVMMDFLRQFMKEWNLQD